MPPSGKPSAPPWTLAPGEPGAPRLLLVEAEFEERSAFEKFLAEYGYDVTTTCDADEAESLLDSDLACDALVVDVVAAEGEGQRVIAFARGHAERASLPVLALADRIDAQVHGADAVLAKPVELELLLERLSELLGNRLPGAPSRSAGLVAKLIAQLEAAGDDPHGSARAVIAKVHQREGNNEEAAYWFICAAEHAESHGNSKSAASWRTLANIIAPPGSHARLAQRKVR